jgi:hypothetical protein
MLEWSWKLISVLSVDLSLSLTSQCVVLTALALVTLGVPMIAALGLSSPGRPSVFGVSLGLSIGTGGIGLATFIGSDGCGLLASTCGLVLFFVAMVNWTRQRLVPINEPANIAHPQPVVVRIENLPHVFALMVVGVLWVIGQRLIRQLVPDSLALMSLECGTLAVGIATGHWLSRNNSRGGILACGLGLSGWIWLCLAVFPLGVRLALWENATISQVWLLQSLRLTMAALVLAPMATAAGGLIGRNGSVVGIAFAFCSVMATNWLLPSVGVWSLTLMATSVLLVVAVRRTVISTSPGLSRWFPAMARRDVSSTNVIAVVRKPVIHRGKLGGINVETLGRVAIAATVFFTVSAPIWVRYRPELAAKVLFDTGVFVASRTETPWEQLPVLDEGRSALVVEGDRGTLTAWRFSGSRFLVRENGVPKGTLATKTQLAPRFVTDVLPTVLPLVTHERPQSILLLGLRTGEPAVMATMFPLRRIVCLEADRGVLKLSRALLSSNSDTSPFNDDRLEARVCDQALAIRTMSERFDVIVASADQPSLPQSANGFTVESLRAAGNCLNDDGVFAIRFQHIDLGPRSVRGLAATMSAAFREVAAIEVAPGELLFLGTNSELGFARDGFIERCQRPHVRELLASVGWDWCTPLRLPMLSHDAIQELVQPTEAVVNVASHSTWPFRLPTEVMRWDNKLQQVQAELAPHECFLMAWGGDEANNSDIASRLSEWELSRAIIRRHSDEFWAYRKSVKEHMTSSSRAMIQQAGHSSDDSELHADDRRRLSYFRAIGELAKNPNPTEADFDRVRRFESPFDPLVSPFLHQELVELTPRCSDRDLAAELHHRLAAIYFSTPADRSIRNVADALLFVNSTPAAIPDNAERYDHLNALLQMLLARWGARGEFRPTSSHVALNDIERSIAAVEASFTTLESLSAQAGVSPAEWQARQQYLERRLVRPLRTYRGQVLQHYVKNERTKEVIDHSDALKPLSE